MAKSIIIPYILSVFVTLFCSLFRIPVLEKAPNVSIVSEAEERRDLVVKIYTAEVGVREATNHNDGQRVEEYLAYTGLRKGNPWCSAFVCWALGKAGIPNPRSAYCPTLFKGKLPVWKAGQEKLLKTSMATRSPKSGDVFGLYFPEKGRIAHVGFIHQWGDIWVVTVEGNTNQSGSREGDGVLRKRRLRSSLHSVISFVSDDNVNGKT